jgi:16S rRNA (cytosine1402-N4)-methyltransferase
MPPNSEVRHRPVMPDEVLRLLDPRPGETWVDCTVGGGGHARLIAQKIGPGGRLIGLDQDPTMLERAGGHLAGLPVTLIHANFDQLPEVLANLGIESVDGVLADLGFASDQLEEPARGLSFRAEGPLDMRLDPTAGTPAAELVNTMSEPSLADLFFEYGEERQSRRVARKIVERRKSRPFATTSDLADVVRSCVRKSGSIDPATRVFQALRIAVNDELGALDRLLAALPRVVKPGGRAGIISFHSLEDRRVKHAFRIRELWEPVTRKPVEATDAETAANPRARSAKLRVARRTNE